MTAAPPRFRRHDFDTLASSNDTARDWIRAGRGGDGDVILAHRQTAGRGRRGNTWQAPAGNLSASVIIRPAQPMRDWAQLGLVAGLAAAEAIGPRARLKWPNDLLLDDAKCGGLLTEIEGAHAIIGIGVNIAAAPVLEAGAFPVACLAAQGVETAPDVLCDVILDRLGARLAAWEAGGFPALREDWRARMAWRGAVVSLWRADGGAVTGILRDIAVDGAAVVDVDGSPYDYHEGEIKMLRKLEE